MGYVRTGFIAGAVALFVAVSAARVTHALQAAQSQWDGIYTLEQAERGGKLYAKNCGWCHGPDLTGGETGPALRGDDFAASWDGATVGEIFERIRISMPQGDPGSMSPEEKADVLAFVLSRGGYPAGMNELVGQNEALKAIAFRAAKPPVK